MFTARPDLLTTLPHATMKHHVNSFGLPALALLLTWNVAAGQAALETGAERPAPGRPGMSPTRDPPDPTVEVDPAARPLALPDPPAARTAVPR